MPKSLTVVEPSDAQSLAVRLASRGEGWVSPNPLVGCVLLDADGRFLGAGYHQEVGQAHAEINALKDAEKRGHESLLRGATAYVTLEPCSHHGRTGPCSEALIRRGIKRVVYGSKDPNPKVDGANQLKASGLEVIQDAGWQRQTDRLAEIFLFGQKSSRPFIALKIARDPRHCIGDRQVGRWPITEGELLTAGILLRQRYDGILVGKKTFLMDQPQLTMRAPHHRPRDPQKIIFDQRAGEGSLSWLESLKSTRGIHSLLVEGGCNTWKFFLAQGCVDKIYLFQSSRPALAKDPLFFDDKVLDLSRAFTTLFPEGTLYETYLR